MRHIDDGYRDPQTAHPLAARLAPIARTPMRTISGSNRRIVNILAGDQAPGIS
jgi:hypothetical protein